MREDSLRAKKYLENKQFAVYYFLIDKEHHSINNDNLLHTEEYPDYIPRKEEAVIIGDGSYFIQNIAYDTHTNKLYLMIMAEKEYRDLYLREKRKHI